MATDILSRRLADIDEAALKALETGAIPESLELEYKRELNLGPKSQRREAAKDVSAMANTVGGRLLYGIDEKVLPDGSKVAGPIIPLTDGAVTQTLSDLLATTIHPRPLVAFQRIDVGSGGFVLVVDVRPAAVDLHMVTGYGVNSYYRRLPGSAVPMTEPEVRERYARVLATRRDLEVRERELMEPEEKRREKAEESIFIVPVYASTSLVNPGDVGALKTDVEAVLSRAEVGLAQEVSLSLRTESDGCRTRESEGAEPFLYIAVLKSGLVHWSFDGAFDTTDPDPPDSIWNLDTLRMLTRILHALELARRVYERVWYPGPVRIHYVLRAPKSFTLDVRGPALRLTARIASRSARAGSHRPVPVEAYLAQRGYSRIAKQLMDPLFHAFAAPGAHWFDAAGTAFPATRERLGAEVASLLD